MAASAKLEGLPGSPVTSSLAFTLTRAGRHFKATETEGPPHIERRGDHHQGPALPHPGEESRGRPGPIAGADKERCRQSQEAHRHQTEPWCEETASGQQEQAGAAEAAAGEGGAGVDMVQGMPRIVAEHFLPQRAQRNTEIVALSR